MYLEIFIKIYDLTQSHGLVKLTRHKIFQNTEGSYQNILNL